MNKSVILFGKITLLIFVGLVILWLGLSIQSYNSFADKKPDYYKAGLSETCVSYFSRRRNPFPCTPQKQVSTALLNGAVEIITAPLYLIGHLQ